MNFGPQVQIKKKKGEKGNKYRKEIYKKNNKKKKMKQHLLVTKT